MKAPRPLALSTFLTRMVWLAMLPLLVLSGWLALSHVRAMEAAEEEAGRTLAADVAEHLNDYLNARVRALAMLAASPLADEARGWPALYKEAQAFQQNLGSHVILADTSWHMLFNTRVPLGAPLPPLPRPRGRSAAQSALETGAPAVGDSFLGPVAGEPLVAIAAPGLRGGKAAYLMLTTLETRRLGLWLASRDLPAGWGLCLRDGNGEVIARRGPPDTCSAPAGEKQLFAALPTLSHWVVQVEAPRHQLRNALAGAALPLAGGILFATLAGLLGGRFAGRRITDAVAGLADRGAALPSSDIAEIARVRARLEAEERGRSGAEEALRQSEERFRRLFQEAPLALGLVGHGGATLAQNGRFDELFGYTMADMPTMEHWWRLAYPDPAYRHEAQARWQEAVARAAYRGGRIEAGEYHVTGKDGTPRTVIITGIRLDDGILSGFVDITGRKEAERRLAEAQDEALEFQRQGRLAALNQMEDANAARRAAEAASAALQESRERLQLFIEHAPASLAMFDREMRYLAVSRRWLDDYGLGGRDILGRSHYEVFPEIGADWKAVHRRALEGEVVRADRDRFVRADGSAQWLRWEARPWHAADGAVGGIVIFTEDITRFQEAQEEIRRLNASLEQRVVERTAELSAANAELDAFAYAVSHDLRAPLRAMSGFSRALVEDYGDGLAAEARDYLAQIEIAARKMGELIDGILALSRSTRGELRRDEVDLSALCLRLLAELALGEPERRAEFRVAEGLAVRGDARMIEAALRNLLGNAWKYSTHQAVAEIRVAPEDRAGRRWFCVSDNGAGFDMAHAARLFQPFQRLHRQDEFPGLGIGLATVQRIVHRHGGAIEARGEPGAGARFCFTFDPDPADNAAREDIAP